MLGCFCDVCPLLDWRVCACVKGTQSPVFGSPKCKLFWMMEANMVSNNNLLFACTVKTTLYSPRYKLKV